MAQSVKGHDLGVRQLESLEEEFSAGFPLKEGDVLALAECLHLVFLSLCFW